MKSKSANFILAAAGTGKRFGQKIPKQYLKINNIPIFMYSIIKASKISLIENIIIVKNSQIKDSYINKILKNFNIKKKITLVNGSSSRFNSVKKAFLSSAKINNEYTIVHDAVRPNFNISKIRKMINEIKGSDGIIPIEKIQDTIKKIKNKNIFKTIPRDSLYLSQTPQIFITKSLESCYAKIKHKSYFSDECQMFEENKFKIKFYINDEKKIKITTKKDLEFLKKNINHV